MKQSIKERMDNAIMNVTNYNTLFDLAVEVTETEFEQEMTMQTENMFVLTTESLVINVICNDNEYSTVTITINNLANDERLANMQMNIHGEFLEDYVKLPKSVRMLIYSYAADLSDALEEWVNSLNTNTENNE